MTDEKKRNENHAKAVRNGASACDGVIEGCQNVAFAVEVVFNDARARYRGAFTMWIRSIRLGGHR